MILRNLFKTALAAGIISCGSISASAQGAYVKVGGGYNFGVGSSIYFHTTGNGNYLGGSNPNGYMKFNRINVAHGKGGVFGGTFGYMVNNNIGVELGVNYLVGGKSKFKYEEQIRGLGFGNINFPLQGVSPFSYPTETFNTKSQLVLVQPSIIIASGLPKFNPYIRMGLVVAKGSFKNTYSFSDSNGENSETEDSYFGGMGFGLQAALGLNFRLTNNVSIFSEGTFNNLTYSPEKGELTKYTRRGTDLMPTFNTSQKEIIFKDEVASGSNNPQSTSSPSIGLKQNFGLNSVGLNIGVKFSF